MWRTALVGPARAPAAASFASRRLLVGRLNPRLFNDLLLFMSRSPFFSFPASRFVLKHQGTASATFEPAPFLRAGKKIAFGSIIDQIVHVLLTSGLAARRLQPSAAREGGSMQLRCALMHRRKHDR